MPIVMPPRVDYVAVLKQDRCVGADHPLPLQIRKYTVQDPILRPPVHVCKSCANGMENLQIRQAEAGPLLRQQWRNALGTGVSSISRFLRAIFNDHDEGPVPYFGQFMLTIPSATSTWQPL